MHLVHIFLSISMYHRFGVLLCAIVYCNTQQNTLNSASDHIQYSAVMKYKERKINIKVYHCVGPLG